MDKQQRKEFFLKEIAPALSDLGRKCQKAGLSFLAAVEWDRNAGEFAFNRSSETSDLFNVAITALENHGTEYGSVDTFLSEMMLLLHRKPRLSSYEVRPKDGREV